MNKFIKINDRKIGYDFEPAIIAEIGINHGGSLEVAKKMVDEAKKAGIEIIKHQTHIVDDEMSSEAKKNKIGYIGKSIYDLMEECALSYNDELELKKYRNINFKIVFYGDDNVDYIIANNRSHYRIISENKTTWHSCYDKITSDNYVSIKKGNIELSRLYKIN